MKVRSCSRCGGNTDLHLVTIPYEDRPGASGRVLLYCWTCRSDAKSLGVSIPLGLVTDNIFIWLYTSSRATSDPDIAAALVFGKARPELAAILQKSPNDTHTIGDSREPSWRAAIRTCRLCIDTTPPLIYVGVEGTAAPLFHEEGNTNAEVLFVVEAPNYDDTFELSKRRLTVDPDTDPSGRFFYQRLVDDLGLRPEDVMVTNSVLCLPAKARGKYPVRAQQRKTCSPHLRTMIEKVDPKIVVPLGTAALEALKLVEPHPFTLGSCVAQPHAWFGRVLFPLYHPSNLGRVSRNTAQQIEDYQALRKLLD